MLDLLERATPPAIADTGHGGVAVLALAIPLLHRDCAFAGTARTVASGGML